MDEDVALRKTIDRLKHDFDLQFNSQVLPPYLEYVKSRRGEDLSRLDDAALLAELEARYRRVLDVFGKEAIKLSYFGGEDYAELAGKLQEIFKDEGQAAGRHSRSGLDNDKTVEANLKLMDVARGKLTEEQFLAEFGHRASQEFELSQPCGRRPVVHRRHDRRPAGRPGRRPVPAAREDEAAPPGSGAPR